MYFFWPSESSLDGLLIIDKHMSTVMFNTSTRVKKNFIMKYITITQYENEVDNYSTYMTDLMIG